MPSFISLYAGAGGLDLGVAAAGFDPAASVELAQDAVDTHRRIAEVRDPEWASAAARFAGHEAICGDVEIEAAGFGRGDADLVIGGPPCQGFSVAGRLDAEDPRSKQVFVFLDVVERVRPVAFIMENVASLATNPRWKEVIERLRERAGAAYDVSLHVLDAADFGVPQHRRRMFLIGLPRGAELRLPTPTPHLASGDAIRHLPAPGEPGNDLVVPARITMARKPVLRRSPYAGMVFNGAGRPVDLTRPAPTMPASMGGNRTAIVDEGALRRGERPWIEGYHAHLAAGGAPYAALPADAPLRRMTGQEAAAVQTFPADHPFSGPRSERLRQIGNAVPPRLGRAVAEAVAAAI